MGQSKGGGYQKLPTISPEQQTLLQQLLGQTGQFGSITQNPLYQQSVEATRQFLPGGQGFAPIQAEAHRQFQQQTLPEIMNAYGSGAKTSSALNQALAGAGQNLNTALASQLAQMQLGAAQQGAQFAAMPQQQALSQASLGLGIQPFAYQPRQTPFWQQLLLGGIGAGGQIGGGMLGR